MEFSGTRWILLGLCIGMIPVLTDALTCYQCNVFVRGTPWPCDSERGMKEMNNCTACLKSYTRAWLHNTFHDTILSTYISRVCVKDRWSAKDEGCHNVVTDSGYMKRCFCYGDRCNHSPVTSLGFPAMLGSLVLTYIVKFLL